MRAFSLIELMVVIAIVSLLSAVAAPVYSNYILRSAILTATAIAMTVVYQSIEYTTLYGGTTPNRDELGLPVDPANSGSDNYTDPSVYSPYLEAVTFSTPATGQSGSNCTQYNSGTIDHQFDMAKLGLDSELFALWVSYDMLYIEGKQYIHCSYIMVTHGFTFYTEDPYNIFHPDDCELLGDPGVNAASTAVCNN